MNVPPEDGRNARPGGAAAGSVPSVADPEISIVVPTLNRPAPLRRALLSALGQEGIDPTSVEIVVVDNSADGNALAGVEALARQTGRRVRTVSMPEPGVANARNAGVAAARGRWIAFLDDDEEAAPRWLATHLATAKTSGADAVFGPVDPQPEEGAAMGPFAGYFDRRIDRPAGADITDLAAYLGTNNSMFRRDRCFDDPTPFDVRLNGCGGEDSLLLARLKRRGRRFVWSADATVTEWVPQRRLTWDYVHRRKRLSGQVRSFTHVMLSPPDRRGLVFWMAVGVVQAVLAGALAILVRPIARDRSQRYRATALGGVGKVFWMERFRPGLYGKGLVS